MLFCTVENIQVQFIIGEEENQKTKIEGFSRLYTHIKRGQRQRTRKTWLS